MAGLLSCAAELLPPGRRAKAERFQTVQDRTNCVFGYLLVRTALKREFSFSPEPADFFYEPNGRPYFDSCPVRFSLSHCKEGILCALQPECCGEIGADIQNVRPVSRATLLRVCSPQEVVEIDASSSPETEFCRLWTLKESLVKQSGASLFGKLSEFDFSGVCRTFSRYGREFFCCSWEKFSFSVCSAQKGNLKIITLSAKDIISDLL